MSDDRELSDLYRSTDKPQPSAALDAAIKAAARQPLKSRRSYALQWIGGVAATLFVALLVVQMLPVIEQQAGYDSVMHDAPQAPPAAEEARINRPARQESAGAVQSLAPRKKVESKKLRTRPKAFMAEDAMSERTAEDRVQRQLPAPPLTADSELQTISKLLDDGKTDQALTRFKAFRQQYPEHAVSEALVKRLEEAEISTKHP